MIQVNILCVESEYKTNEELKTPRRKTVNATHSFDNPQSTVLNRFSD